MKIGDLVKIWEGVHDPAMPANRLGLIIDISTAHPDQMFILFDNGSVLKFHESQLLIVSDGNWADRQSLKDKIFPTQDRFADSSEKKLLDETAQPPDADNTRYKHAVKE